MSYKHIDNCIKKAFSDELLFVLMARDDTTPEVICEWIKRNIRIQPKEKLIEALEAAIHCIETGKIFRERKLAIKETNNVSSL